MEEDEDYTISDARKMEFAGIYLLEYIANHRKDLSIILSRDEEDLEPILEWLMARGHIEIEKQESYVVSQTGKEALASFGRRYMEYLNVFDVYSAVDLEAGEFAFASYHQFKTDEEWKAFLDDERWEDLRVAVADYKEMDPVEIVFMNFIQEQRFGRDQTGWQFDLLLGTVWDEILAICNEAIHEEDLGFESEEGFVSGENVLEDIITQGAALLTELQAKEEKKPPLGSNGWGEFRDENIDYDDYKDPDHRSRNWDDRWSL